MYQNRIPGIISIIVIKLFKQESFLQNNQASTNFKSSLSSFVLLYSFSDKLQYTKYVQLNVLRQTLLHSFPWNLKVSEYFQQKVT